MLRFYEVYANDNLVHNLVQTDCGWIDGYGFGDRLLDGVMFKITIRDNKLMAEIDPSARSYFEELNKEMWLTRAVEYASTQDIFYTDATHGGEVVLYDHSKSFSDQQASFEYEPIFEKKE